MAAPSVTAIGTPGGIKLSDGYSCVYAFERMPTVSLWEKTVQPPGLDLGDAVDQTTMRNELWRTKQSRSLLDLTESQVVCAYDPQVYDDIVELAGQEGSITVHFPDGTTLSFYGFLKSFDPSPLEEGSQPEATVTVVPTNFDPVNKVEAGPAIASVSGT